MNAVYFKGLWESQFDETATTEEEFWVSEKESVKVPMMHSMGNFRYAYSQQLGASLLAMDYQVRHETRMKRYFGWSFFKCREYFRREDYVYYVYAFQICHCGTDWPHILVFCVF